MSRRASVVLLLALAPSACSLDASGALDDDTLAPAGDAWAAAEGTTSAGDGWTLPDGPVAADTTSPGADTATAAEATSDVAPKDAGADAGGATGVQCAAGPCAAGETCCGTASGGGLTGTCTLPSACTSAYFLRCDRPSQCGTGTTCCLALGLAGTLTDCRATSAKTSCVPPTSCPGLKSASCSPVSIPVCATKADCLGSDRCCTGTLGGVSLKLCLPPLPVAIAGIECP